MLLGFSFLPFFLETDFDLLDVIELLDAAFEFALVLALASLEEDSLLSFAFLLLAPHWQYVIIIR